MPDAPRPAGDPAREARFAVAALAGLVLLAALLLPLRGAGPRQLHDIAFLAAPGFLLLVAGLVGLSLARHGRLRRSLPPILAASVIVTGAVAALVGIEFEPYYPFGEGGESFVGSYVEIPGASHRYAMTVPGPLALAPASEPPAVEIGNATGLRVSLSWSAGPDSPETLQVEAQRWDGAAWVNLHREALASGDAWTWFSDLELGRVRIVLERQGGLTDLQVEVGVAAFRTELQTCLWTKGMDPDGPPLDCRRGGAEAFPH